MTYLFIDNDLEDIELYKEAIEYLNASTYIAVRDKRIICLTLTNCSNVIDFVRNLPVKPDIIFLDINMPGVSGKECLKILKSHSETSSIPVVMLSTTCPMAEAYEYKNIGALECIQKPNSFINLVKIFSKFIFQNT